MNKETDNEIIAALATPYGKSAIAAIRICGSGCIDLINKFLEKPLKVGKLEYNSFRAEEFGEKLMAVCFKAPKSYTGDDTVELYPHGNMTVCDGIIKTLIDNGARLAERGEFTKRAFLNGKLDLMRCEALADIIDAQTTEQLIYGNSRFDGEFKGISEAQEALKRALSTVEAAIHYGDELEDGEADENINKDVYYAIDGIIKKLEAETAAYAGGRITVDGFKIALIGYPNVGKSTLLNALTNDRRAIVTPIAGTTRDIIEGSFVYNGRKFVVADCAGITETADPVEKIGVERALETAKTADAAVFVTTDGSVPSIEHAKPTVTVMNKCDDARDVGSDYSRAEQGGMLKISAEYGINITALKQKLYDLCPKTRGAIGNHRQYECAMRCLESCRAAKIEAEKAQGLEIVAAVLYDAYSAIEALYGAQADESVISAVFERFCVGK